MNKKEIWQVNGDIFRLVRKSIEIEELENEVYLVGVDLKGFYLSKLNEKFNFDYKIYGIEENLIRRVVKSYSSLEYGNLGVLLNGLKGTGKTVTAKLIANELKQPIIIVGNDNDGVVDYLNSIPQNISIFIDEYEKIFEKSSSMLTIMDGVMNSKYKRMFILTTNNLHIEQNLLQRPSRIRYIKQFSNLEPIIIEEIINDLLIDKSFKNDCLNFIVNLETITIDIVKSIINEVNLHNESPNNFEDVFNVVKLQGKYNVMLIDGSDIRTLAKNVSFYPSPSRKFNDGVLDYDVEIDGSEIGKIIKVLNHSTLMISLKKTKALMVLKVESANMVNKSIVYDDYGHNLVPPIETFKTLELEEILNKEKEEEKSQSEL